MELHTPRLILRDLNLDDVEALNAIERQERVTRYMSFDPQSLEQTREWIEAAIRTQQNPQRRTFDLAIVPKGTSQLVGRVGLDVSRPEHFEASIWYVLDPAAQGRGYALEAARRMLEFGFADLGLHRIWADCDPRNQRSCRLAERLGMTNEGCLRQNYFLKGGWCDTAVYAVLEPEWRARGESSNDSHEESTSG